MVRKPGEQKMGSMVWLKQSLGIGSGEAPPAGRADSQNPLRDLFTDLMAYVLLVLASDNPPPLGEVRAKITSLVDEQEKRVAATGMAIDTYKTARFAVLSWVDEMIMTSSWPDAGRWQHLMLTYHGTLNAGEEFFDQLEALPSGARDVREIYYLCFRLGFLGKLALDNPADVNNLRRALYRQIIGGPADIHQSYSRLFPEAYRPPKTEAAQPRSRRRLLIGVGAALLVLVLLFATYLVLLRRQSNQLLARLEAPEPVRLAVPAVDWATSLIEELKRKGVDVQDAARGVLVTLPGVMFQVNSSELSVAGERKLEEIASVIKRYGPERRVAVEGHASREPGTLDERNQRLSEARAREAADVLMRGGLSRDKITARGLGSSNPVADNNTEDGRRRNRRVEIIVEKAGG